MTFPAVTLPDCEQIVRDYLRGVDLGAANKRVFKGAPQDGRYPYVAIDGRIGGAPVDQYVPVDAARIQLSVWSSSRDQAMSVAALVVAHLRAAEAALTSSGRLDSVAVTGGPTFVPDNVGKIARYLITALAVCRPS